MPNLVSLNDFLQNGQVGYGYVAGYGQRVSHKRKNLRIFVSNMSDLSKKFVAEHMSVAEIKFLSRAIAKARLNFVL
jgi:hypothetical protein